MTGNQRADDQKVVPLRVEKVIVRAGQLHGLDYVLGVDAEGGGFTAVRIPDEHPWLGVTALSRIDDEVDIGLGNVFWDTGNWWAIRMTLSCRYPQEAAPYAEELAIRVLSSMGKTIVVPLAPVTLPTNLFSR